MLISAALFKRLCRARRLLQEDEEAARTIGQVARQVGLSRFHLIRRFQALFGVTPHQFRINARLERAQRLLGDGRPVTDACLEVGFCSPASFSHLFARRIGVKPSVYRHQGPAPGCITLMASPAAP